MKGLLVAIEDEFDDDLTACEEFGHQHTRTLYEDESIRVWICNDCGEEGEHVKSNGRSL